MAGGAFESVGRLAKLGAPRRRRKRSETIASAGGAFGLRTILLAVVGVMIYRASMAPHSEDRPPRVQPRLIGAPKIRGLYWCDFPKDAQLPEFWKCRPIVVISKQNTLHGAVTVVPCSTHSQPQNPWAVKLKTSIDGERESWVVCDKPTTVAVSRLSPPKRQTRVTQDELIAIMRLVLDRLPMPPI